MGQRVAEATARAGADSCHWEPAFYWSGGIETGDIERHVCACHRWVFNRLLLFFPCGRALIRLQGQHRQFGVREENAS